MGSDIYSDLYADFAKSINKHIPRHYFKHPGSSEANASAIENHQFIHFLQDVPFVVGIFNTLKMGYEFFSPNFKDVLGCEEDFLGENGSRTILSNFKPEHGQIFNTHIFPAIFDYYKERIPHHDIKDFRFTASFGLVQKDNSTKWFAQHITVIDTDANGFPLLNLICIFDISGMKKDDLVDFIVARRKNGQPYSNIYAAGYSEDQKSSIMFTERELEIVSLMAKDKTSKEIADQLCISIHTVSNHRKRMLAKTGATTAAGLVQLALNRRFIDKP